MAQGTKAARAGQGRGDELREWPDMTNTAIGTAVASLGSPLYFIWGPSVSPILTPKEGLSRAGEAWGLARSMLYVEGLAGVVTEDSFGTAAALTNGGLFYIAEDWDKDGNGFADATIIARLNADTAAGRIKRNDDFAKLAYDVRQSPLGANTRSVSGRYTITLDLGGEMSMLDGAKNQVLVYQVQDNLNALSMNHSIKVAGKVVGQEVKDAL